jgi:iron complex transport system permease protein
LNPERKAVSFKITVLLLLLLMIFLSVMNLAFGSVHIGFNDLLSVLWPTGTTTGNYSVIIIEYRLPQVLTAMSVGAGLSIAGLLLQTVFRNPLAGPSVLGISAGASLGVALVIMAGSALGIDLLKEHFIISDMSIVVAAFAGALFVLSLIMYVSGKIGNVVTVLIIGIMLGYLVSATVGILQYFSGREELQAFVLWGLGSFAKNSLDRSIWILATTFIIVMATFPLATPLNAMLLGENYARSLGFNIKKYNTVILLTAGLLIALGTAFTGPIAFLGLAVPHIARAVLRSADHKILIPVTLLAGVDFALLSNLLSRLPGFDISLPVNAVTSVIGAPMVIWVIVKRSKIKVN